MLAETCLALGVIFASLAIPLGLDARWTAAAWAVEGAGIFWLGLRQRRPLARAFALLLQLGSALAFISELHSGEQPARWCAAGGVDARRGAAVQLLPITQSVA